MFNSMEFIDFKNMTFSYLSTLRIMLENILEQNLAGKLILDFHKIWLKCFTSGLDC